MNDHRKDLRSRGVKEHCRRGLRELLERLRARASPPPPTKRRRGIRKDSPGAGGTAREDSGLALILAASGGQLIYQAAECARLAEEVRITADAMLRRARSLERELDLWRRRANDTLGRQTP